MAQIEDTDAEGRLVLADALVYAERLGVDSIVDIATCECYSRAGASSTSLSLRAAPRAPAAFEGTLSIQAVRGGQCCRRCLAGLAGRFESLTCFRLLKVPKLSVKAFRHP